MDFQQYATSESVNLCNCQITDEHVKALVAAVANSKSLENIYLLYNQITDVGAFSIAAAIEKSKSLRYINLWGNQITKEGAKALAAVVQKSRSLFPIYVDIDFETIRLVNWRTSDVLRARLQVLAFVGRVREDGDNAISALVLQMLLPPFLI